MIAMFAMNMFVLMFMVVIVPVVMAAFAVVVRVEIAHFLLLGELAQNHVAFDHGNMVDEGDAV